MTLASNRTMGFVGTLLMVLGSVSQFLGVPKVFSGFVVISFVSSIFGVLSFVGIILFLVAMYGLSRDYEDSPIFNNALYGFLAAIIGAVLAGILAVVLIFSNIGNIVNMFNSTSVSFSFTSEAYRAIIGYLLPVFVAGYFVALVQMLFYMRAFNRLAEKSEVKLFKPVGLLLVVSAIAGVLVAVISALLIFGALASSDIIWYLPLASGAITCAAWIVAARAFLAIKVPASQGAQPVSSYSYAPPSGKVRYCRYCGAPNKAYAAYCGNCGNKL
jgi:uncharacterized membrane protein